MLNAKNTTVNESEPVEAICIGELDETEYYPLTMEDEGDVAVDEVDGIAVEFYRDFFGDEDLPFPEEAEEEHIEVLSAEEQLAQEIREIAKDLPGHLTLEGDALEIEQAGGGQPLIHGLLHKHRKMMISGPSKAGKSLLLMQLCIALVTGGKWLGRFLCEKTRVLYINMEIDAISCQQRVSEMYQKMGLPNDRAGFSIWTLKGYGVSLGEIIDSVICLIQIGKYDVVIFDPVFKLLGGDENSTKDITEFTTQLDRICRETDAAIIYCHHHAKAAESRQVLDRAAGSGVFVRDADAIIDITTAKKDLKDCYIMEGEARDFESFGRLHLQLDYPIHKVVDQED